MEALRTKPLLSFIIATNTVVGAQFCRSTLEDQKKLETQLVCLVSEQADLNVILSKLKQFERAAGNHKLAKIIVVSWAVWGLHELYLIWKPELKKLAKPVIDKFLNYFLENTFGTTKKNRDDMTITTDDIEEVKAQLTRKIEQMECQVHGRLEDIQSSLNALITTPGSGQASNLLDKKPSRKSSKSEITAL